MDKQQVNDKINRVENSPKNAYNAFVAQRLRQLASTWKGKNADAQFLHFLAGTYCKTGEEPGCPSRKCRRLSTGLNSLDKFTKGLANGDLMVVGGYKEQGKTAGAENSGIEFGFLPHGKDNSRNGGGQQILSGKDIISGFYVLFFKE